MRLMLFAALGLLAGCAGGSPDQFATHAPSLKVGRAALDGGSPQIALQVANQTLQSSPSSVDAYLVQGGALAALGRPDEAEASFRHALALDAGSAEAKLGLGRLMLAKDPRAAELLFLDVLSTDARNPAALNDLGIARDLQGRHDDAQAAYRQALGLQPTNEAALVNLALSLALSGHAGAARDLLRPLADAADASPRVRHDFAAVSAMAGDRAGAEAAFQNDLSPEDLHDALESYGALSGARGRREGPGAGAP
jgi:Flp pilus assembly protein TadD